MKLKCIEGNEKYFTVGEVYDLVDGQIIDDYKDGSQWIALDDGDGIYSVSVGTHSVLGLFEKVKG